MIKRFFVLAACILCMAAVSAQSLDNDVKSSISKYIKDFESPRASWRSFSLDTDRRDNIVLDNSGKRLTVYVNYRFFQQPFTQGLVDTIYNGIRDLLPRKLRKYSISVTYGGRTIEDMVPNVCRTGDVDNSRMWGRVEYDGLPWVDNVSCPYDVKSGLSGRHIVVSQSHGYYFNKDLGWRWQRPRLYCTTEDLFTQSIVVPFLMPMLENAGAVIYTPRERDWQRNSVIVDNDFSQGHSKYTERNGRGKEWSGKSGGYLFSAGPYSDGDTPFSDGTSRYVDAVRREGNSVAEIKWTPDIPEDGNYAVYVTYSTFANSVPDASYSVVHSGGTTQFKVNQTMGGGTWAYLGTFYFRKGADSGQCVSLTNVSAYDGVVSADAVRFGGGMGNVARGNSNQVSGMPRYLEGSRYNLQLSGFPYAVYSPSPDDDKSDKIDDTNSRSHALNYLSGGSVYNPDTTGLNVPLEFSLSFHSDAGYHQDDNIFGSLAIVQTLENDGELRAGPSRRMSRDAASFMLNNLQADLSAHFGTMWPVRCLYDAYNRNGRVRQNYSEARNPAVPSMIFESLSHQNFMDMVYGHNPDFKFTMARSVYKSLLRHLCFVHGEECVVQPLPVSNMSLSLSANSRVATLRWSPVEDPLEPTATPDRYVVYTKIGNGGYDNGTVVDRAYCTIQVQKGYIYSFKVAALNEGGESLPSEELSLYVADQESERVLVVNGFHRLSGPEVVSDGMFAGFDMEVDPGVPYMYTPEYCGPQLDFQRSNIGNESGLGLSGDSYEGMLIAGNTFDYPRVHGEALAANNISFVSCSSEAVINGSVNLSDYRVVDLILGVEKQGEKGSYLGYDRPYKTFPLQLQQKISDFCRKGGNLFVSGAFLASDMTKNSTDNDFIRNVLHVDFGGSVTNISENRITGSGLSLEIRRGVNEKCYAVSRPDVLVPVGNAFVSFVFDGGKQSAGVAYAGDYRVLSTSFPFEAVTDSREREKLMGAVMRFLMQR